MLCSGKIKVNFNTRQAMEQDREQLFMLYGKVLREHITSIWGWDDIWQRNDFDGHFKPQQITIFTVENKIVGYMELEDRIDLIWLRMIAILPENQNKRIGSGAMIALIDRANHQEKDIGLQVFKINTDAQRFYTRLGFTIIEETATHFVMRLKPRSLTFTV